MRATRASSVAHHGQQADRIQVQRRRIIAAAEQCLVAKGLHGASIADIAAAAGMSQGLLYRYFRNKDAILRAIIGDCLNAEASTARDQLATADDVVEAVLALFETWSRGDQPRMNAALMLETTAEATRSPEIATAVREANMVARGSLESVMRRSLAAQGVALDEAQLRSRTIVLQACIEGLAIRAIREPTLDRLALKDALSTLLASLTRQAAAQ